MMTTAEATKEKKYSTKKIELIAEFSEKFKAANSVVLVEYKGMKVAQFTELRLKLRAIDSEIHVLRNRLMKIAVAADEGTAKLVEELSGPVAAVIINGDPLEAAKIIADFSEDAEQFIVKKAVVSGDLMESETVAKLAKIPSREVLLTQLVGLLTSPLRRLVTALSQPPRSIVQTLAAIQKSKEG